MKRLIFKYPQDKEILTKESYKVEVPFTEEIKQTIEDLIDTLKDSGGAGISAIQIGKPYQICIINWDGIHVLVNPEVTRFRGQHTMKEGCLSVPGLWVEKTRAQKVWVKALNEKEEEIEYAEGGNGSYIVQHELDHFRGTCSLFDAYDEIQQMKEKEN